MNDCAPPLDPKIAFALLAAGKGRRFGGGKLVADLGGSPLWRWAARSVEQAGFVTRYLIVPGDGAFVMGEGAEGWTIAENPDADEGISTSIRRACELATDCYRLVVALADMPFVEPDHLRTLAGGAGVIFTGYKSGRLGVPAAFPRDAFPRLAGLTGDRGAAALDWGQDAISVRPTSYDSLLDIDRNLDLEHARMLARSRA